MWVCLLVFLDSHSQFIHCSHRQTKRRLSGEKKKNKKEMEARRVSWSPFNELCLSGRNSAVVFEVFLAVPVNATCSWGCDFERSEYTDVSEELNCLNLQGRSNREDIEYDVPAAVVMKSSVCSDKTKCIPLKVR